MAALRFANASRPGARLLAGLVLALSLLPRAAGGLEILPAPAVLPWCAIGFPLDGMGVPANAPVTITGTASAPEGVSRVEVSVDGGVTWLAAAGTERWSRTWTPRTAGSARVRARATDGAGRVETAGEGLVLRVLPPDAPDCPCTLWPESTVPAFADAGDPRSLEVGVRFHSEVDGFVDAVRFFRLGQHAAPHVVNLWTAGGTRLATRTFHSGPVNGWHEAKFDTPVPVARDSHYVASVFMPIGRYAITEAFFAAVEHARPPLHAPPHTPGVGNGVYAYGPESTFPAVSGGSNYWVDVRLGTADPGEPAPPRVTAISPGDGEDGVGQPASVRVTFDRGVDVAMLTAESFRLEDAAGAALPATRSWDEGTRTATLEPRRLAGASLHRVRLTTAITDRAGRPLAGPLAWSFHTAPEPAAGLDEGPGGPIVVLASTANPYTRYVAEILRAEGLNAFTVRDLAATEAAGLDAFDVAILGDQSLSARQAEMLAGWVERGGNLIALRPDDRLAGLLGLTPASGVLRDASLRIDPGTVAGAGIVKQPIQFHGAADLRQFAPGAGAEAIAWLGTAGGAPLPHPAVSLRRVGPHGGQAAAFAYDLARSVVHTRQGNPAWAGQERDGQPPLRSNDLFVGAAAFDPQPDWVDFANIAIPQADEQQRLLANLVVTMNADRIPLPRFWYLPRGLRAVLVMTADDHGTAGAAARFDTLLARSTPGCSVDDWECLRSSLYLMTAPPFTDAQARFYHEHGFEIAVHVTTSCLNPTPAQLAARFDADLAGFAAAYPGVPPPVSNRTHCALWSGYVTQPEIEAARGIRLDTNYYYWPAEFVGGRAGMFTGSGLPMRFARADGSIVDCYQATTQFTDDAAMSIPADVDFLLDRALGPEGYYGAFTCNVHDEMNPNHVLDAILASARARDVPVISGRQMLTWLDGRNGSAFRDFAWSNGELGFRVEAADGARNLQALLPATAGEGDSLHALERDGVPLPLRFETVKGIGSVRFDAPSGTYRAVYGAATVGAGETRAAGRLALGPIVPQPARSDVRIAFHLPGPARARLRLFGVRGDLVRTIALGFLPGGPSSVAWDRRDDAGREVAAGVYVARLEAAGGSATRRIVLLR
jgi:hypothetical protein